MGQRAQVGQEVGRNNAAEGCGGQREDRCDNDEPGTRGSSGRGDQGACLEGGAQEKIDEELG